MKTRITFFALGAVAFVSGLMMILPLAWVLIGCGALTCVGAAFPKRNRDY